jgi:hypothetical protein
VQVLIRTVARLAGIAAVLLGLWVFGVNLVQSVLGENGYDPRWMVWVILAWGIVGAAGGVVFLLSLDGPEPWHTQTRRLIGWLGMLVLAVLPSVTLLVMLPLTLVAGISLFEPHANPTAGDVTSV